MKKLALILLGATVMMFALTACGGSFMNESEIKDIENPTGTITISYEDENGQPQSFQTIKFKFELYYKQAPITVTNFVSLVNKGYYDDLLFHRLETTTKGSSDDSPIGRVLQGGGYRYKTDPDDNDKRVDLIKKDGAPNYKIKGEFKDNGWTAAEALTNTNGTFAMARTAASMDSASDEFYINIGSNESFDGKYAVFGKIVTPTGSELSQGYSDPKILTDYFMPAHDQSVETESFTGKTVSAGYIPKGALKIKSITVDTHGVDLGTPKKV